MDFRITPARMWRCMATSKGSTGLAADHRDGKITLTELNAKASEAGVAACRQSNGAKKSETAAEPTLPSSS